MNYRLTTYVDKIEKKYIKAREEWEKLQKSLEAEEKRYNSLDWKMYTFEGQQAEYTKHNEIKREITKHLEDLREDFLKDAESIREDSDIIFDSKYKFTSEEIDQNGVSLLQIGNLGLKDLMRLAADYKKKGNNTMYFLVASKMKEFPELQTDSEAFSFYSQAEREKNYREDHAILEDMVKLCVSGLRNEDYLSNGIDKQHETLFEGLRLRADEVTREVVSPWE